jgi:histone acetyltransferase (RNA polymerase elongator complex component)
LNAENATREIINALILLPSPTHDDVNRLKTQTAAKYHLEKVPSNADLISTLTPTEAKQLLPILKRKTTRTI